MQGKGWFIIYGVLLLLVIGLLAGLFSLNGRVSALSREVANLKQGAPSAAPSPEASPVPSVSPEPDLATPEGRDAKRKADLAKIRAALEAFRAETNTFPKALAELSPKYLPERPADPSPGKTYRYAKTPGGFRLTSVLESDDPEDVSSVDPKKDKLYLLTEKSPVATSPAVPPSPAPAEPSEPAGESGA